MRYFNSKLPAQVGLCSVFFLSTVFGGGTRVAPRKAAPAPKAASSSARTPYVGEVTGNRVNVRAGGSVNYRILRVANKGDRLTVRRIKNGWAQVDVPKGTYLYISKKYVRSDKVGKGNVTADRVNVRPLPDLVQPPLCQLHRGDSVTIISSSGNFYKIAPPAEAHAWITSKYVKFVGELQQVRAIARKKKEVDSFRVELSMIEKRDREEFAKMPGDRNIDGLIQAYSDFIAKAKANPEFKLLAMQRRNELQEKQDLNRQKEETDAKFAESQNLIEDLRKKYQSLEQQHQALVEQVSPPPPPPSYLATGVVKPLIRLWNRPGTHKLVDSRGKTLFMLKSDRLNLEDFVGKKVGVNGDELDLAGWNANLIDVEEVDIKDTIASK